MSKDIINEIITERKRQIDKGWTYKHDDTLVDEQLTWAAAAYATGKQELHPVGWVYKPSTKRRMLIKAAALIVAEIERLDRKADDHKEMD